MLNINFGKNKDYTEDRFINSYFISKFDDKWFDDLIVKKLLLSVHNTKYVGNQTFKSDWLNFIPAEKLYTSVKCAILLMQYQKEGREFYPDLTSISKNLYPFIMEYAKDNEMYVRTTLDDLYLSNGDFTFRCTNNNKVYHTLDDLYELNYEYYIKKELEELEDFNICIEKYYSSLEKTRDNIRVNLTGNGKDIFDITLNRKINVILDEFSTGTSYLCNVIRSIGGAYKRLDGCTELNLTAPNYDPSISWLEYIKEKKDYVIFLDEDFSAKISDSLLKEMVSDDNTYVLITRIVPRKLAYSACGMYNIVRDNNILSLEENDKFKGGIGILKT